MTSRFLFRLRTKRPGRELFGGRNRLLATLVLAHVAVLLPLAGCGSEDGEAAEETKGASPAAAPKWPDGAGYVSPAKNRPASPHHVRKCNTDAKIVAVNGGRFLLDGRVEYRESKSLLVFPGARIENLCKTPSPLALNDYNKDECLLPQGIIVTVDDYGQFVPVGGDSAAQGTSAGRSGGPPTGGPRKYLERISLDVADDPKAFSRAMSGQGRPLLASCRIKERASDGKTIGYFIHQVAAAGLSADTACYKIGYSIVVGSDSPGISGFTIARSMWLTLKKSGDQWTWDHARYLKKSHYARDEIQPPSAGLFSEEEIGPKGHLTRSVLRKAGFNP